MKQIGFRIPNGILFAACLFLPMVASANVVMLNSSLMDLCLVVFWAIVVEAALVALLLGLRGIAPLRFLMAWFVLNGAGISLWLHPLLTGSNNPPVLALEGLLRVIDGLLIKLPVTLASFQADNHRTQAVPRSSP